MTETFEEMQERHREEEYDQRELEAEMLQREMDDDARLEQEAEEQFRQDERRRFQEENG